MMKRILLAVFLMALSSNLHGQGAPIGGTAQFNSSGTVKVIPSAVITVCSAGSPGTPCSPKVSVFSNSALTIPLSNPFNSDLNGNYQYFIAPGIYTETVTGVGFQGFSHQVSSSIGASGSVTSIATTSPITGGPITNTGTLGFSATPTTCANQFITALSATATGTCNSATLASAQFANQGTTSTVLHGNAAGNPSFGAVALATDVSGQLPISNVGSVGLSGTSPIAISGAGAISCSTCTQTIASGTSTMGTSGIPLATCAAAVTTSATGTASTDAIIVTVNADPTAVTGYVPLTTGSLYIWPYPTTNNVNFRVCNNTSATITPSAITLNWRVVR